MPKKTVSGGSLYYPLYYPLTHESCALSSKCTGARMLFLLVWVRVGVGVGVGIRVRLTVRVEVGVREGRVPTSMMQPFMIISSRMKCAWPGLG